MNANRHSQASCINPQPCGNPGLQFNQTGRVSDRSLACGASSLNQLRVEVGGTGLRSQIWEGGDGWCEEGVNGKGESDRESRVHAMEDQGAALQVETAGQAVLTALDWQSSPEARQQALAYIESVR